LIENVHIFDNISFNLMNVVKSQLCSDEEIPFAADFEGNSRKTPNFYILTAFQT